MRLTQTRTGRTALVVATLALIGAACGSDDDDTGTTATGQEATATPLASGAPQPTKSTIKIGMLVDVTGLNPVSFAPSADVARAWQEWVNTEMGGINGHPVEVIIKDSKSSAAVATQVANELIREDKIIAAVGTSDATVDPVSTRIFTDAKVPQIGGLLLSVGPVSPYVFFVAAGSLTGIQLTMDVAKTFAPQKVAGVMCTEAAQCAAGGQVLEERATALGLEWGGFLLVAQAEANYTAACLTLQERGVDYVQIIHAIDVVNRLIADCTKQGYIPSYYGLSSGVVVGEVMREMSATGISFAGYTNGFPWWAEDDPNVELFRRVMLEYGDANRVPEGPAQSAAWASFELFRKAMADASDNPTSDEVLTAMNMIQDEELGGLLPEPVSYPAGATPEPLRCAWSFTVKDGEFTGGDKVCPTE